MSVSPKSHAQRTRTVQLDDLSADASSTAISRRSTRRGWLVAPLVAVLIGGGAAACGSDSTVDNNAQSSSAESSVPSVSSSATDSSETPSGSDATSKSSAADASGESSAPATTAEDGSVTEVEDVPAGGNRSGEDEDFLKELKNQGIDFDKAGDKDASANLQDQVIAAAKASCEKGGDTRIRNYLPMTAGQLQAQGVVDKPEDAAKAIQDAAKKVYCK